MGWFGRMADRYEAWRSKTEGAVVRDILLLQLEAAMEERGLLVVRNEKAFVEVLSRVRLQPCRGGVCSAGRDGMGKGG